ncbi:MAG TPA: histidine phosphatase family protein [Hyphomicrobiaceae bacterium]|nr:histidine phosphatase family protein [Hyphomicrobiaceae bacterium]
MLTLSLLRHAKSSWSDPELDDHERPLAKRGIKDAPRIGRFMAAAKLVPDLVLCSGAVRTRATLTLVLAELPHTPAEILYEEDLYLAAPAAMLARLSKVKLPARHVLMVGHNPGLQALALELTGEGARKGLAGLAGKFPTGALAVIDFDLGSWSALRAASGRLRLFVTPRRLA